MGPGRRPPTERAQERHGGCKATFRTMNWTPIAVLGCLACLILSACGEDRRLGSGPGPGPTTTTGTGGAPSTSSTGGMGGIGGMGGGTSTGEGGSSNFGEDGPSCFACVQGLSEGLCGTEFTTCFTFSGCQGWYGCIDDCAHAVNSHDCYTNCDEAFLPSNSSNQNLKACACDECAADCPSLCTCGYLVE